MKNDSVLVSVIMTVRNGEKTITETLESILNQTHNLIEVIIVNDGSTDQTELILESFLKKDSRVKVISSGGIGRARALNLAIKNSNSDYIANIDVDDPSHPQRIEIQLDSLIKNNKLSLISSDTIFLNQYEKADFKKISVSEIDSCQVRIINEDFKKNMNVNHSSVMFNAKLYFPIYNEDLEMQVDYDLWLRSILAGNNLGRLNLKLATKRIHENQSFENKNRKKYLKNSIKLKFRYFSAIKAPKKYYLYAYAKMYYGLLPNHVRDRIRKIGRG